MICLTDVELRGLRANALVFDAAKFVTDIGAPTAKMPDVAEGKEILLRLLGEIEQRRAAEQAFQLHSGVTARRLGGTSEFGIYVLTFEPGAKVPEESHMQHERWMTLSGSGIVRRPGLQDRSPDSLLAALPNEIHSIIASDEGLTLLVIATPDFDMPQEVST